MCGSQFNDLKQLRKKKREKKNKKRTFACNYGLYIYELHAKIEIIQGFVTSFGRKPLPRKSKVGIKPPFN